MEIKIQRVKAKKSILNNSLQIFRILQASNRFYQTPEKHKGPKEVKSRFNRICQKKPRES